MPPRYAGYNLAQVRAAIEPGLPSSLEGSADVFANVAMNLDTVATAVRGAVDIVIAGPAPGWSGPAADAFAIVADRVIAAIRSVETSLQPYEPALDGAARALTEAKSALAPYAAQAQAITDTAVSEQFDAAARKILEDLASAYAAAAGALNPIRLTLLEEDEQAEVVDVGPGLDQPSLELLAGVPEPARMLTAVVPPGLVPVDLGGGGLLALGATGVDGDPTTLLAGFRGPLDGTPAPTATVPNPLVPVTSASELRSGLNFAPIGQVSAATHLTTAPKATLGSPAHSAPAANGPHGPIPPLGSTLAGPFGNSSRSTGMPRAIGAGTLGSDDDGEDREPALVGDQVWDDNAGLTDAIGRTRPVQPAQE